MSRKRIFFLFAILGATVAACVYYFPWRDLSSRELVEAHGAAAQWCQATQGLCCPKIGDRAGEVLIRHITWAECEEHVGHKCVASYSWKKRRISIVFGAAKSFKDLRETMLHEVGHHCGIHEHTKRPNTVMHRSNGSLWITPEDIEAFNDGEGQNNG